MGLFNKIKRKKQEISEERNRRCDYLLSQINSATAEANGYKDDANEFVDIRLADQWQQKYDFIISGTTEAELKSLKKASGASELRAQATAFRAVFASIRLTLEEHNNAVAASKINYANSVIGNVEGRALDKQQLLAIAKESHNHLIIAGAGTGKTTTVVGKIKYLLKTEKYKPEDILVLSFTNAFASEMSERIAKETGVRIAASTFHKLGMNIITKAEGVKPKITQINLRALIKEKMKSLLQNREYVLALSKYLLFNRVPEKSEFEFHTEKEYDDYLQTNPPVTILRETVKSYGEMDIANFLFQNGIKYKYEAEYHIDTRTSEYGQYHPDFYLPDYGIYIEYFGIDKNGDVPEWFDSKGFASPSVAYRNSMKWKRKLHKDNGTILVESYAYEKTDGVMLSNLEKNLKSHGVKMTPKSAQELWAMLPQDNNNVLDGLIELFETIINLIRSNNYTIDGFKALASNSYNSSRYKNLIYLIEPLYNTYNDELKDSGEIDFNDMINSAAEYLRSGVVTNPFSFVIVDEYQDISKARFSLLKAMRASRDYDLFCVGDDWQSIYRFAGSDINYIINFEKFWGPTTISKIETTYRFTESLIGISGSFITQNPKQIKKNIKGMSSDRRFALSMIEGYKEEFAVEFMYKIVEKLPRNATVFFLGRYSFDVDLIKNSGIFKCKFNNASGIIEVSIAKRPDLKMSFLTAHKSKGLQADYVFIINNKRSRMGFPSKIQDDPILDLLLDSGEDYPFAEERRLYYVALTRAKMKVFLLCIKGKKSVFVQELENTYGKRLKNAYFECPLCGGHLVKRSGPYGSFLGCENYIKGCRYKRELS